MLHVTSNSRPVRLARRGALAQGCIIGIVLAAVVLIVGMFFASKYNSLASGKQNAEAKWAEIDNQYKRRADLVGNLVETVKGSANFEQETLTKVVEARASVGKTTLPPLDSDDPAKVKAYVEAQQQLGGALSRLLVVAEQYPELKSSQNFLSLQDQLEGTENRIATARRDYIEVVKDYNTRVVTFPGNVIAGMFNFKALPQLEAATPEERLTPKVQFDFNQEKK